MPSLIILPVGLSLLRNLEKEFQVKLPFNKESETLKACWQKVQNKVRTLSVELSILSKWGIEAGDRVALLATDTDDAESAGRANAFLIERAFRLPTEVRRIQGLDLNNAETFLRSGLRNFFSEIEKLVILAEEQDLKPVIGIAGGIKAVLPYAAIYGMLRSVPVVYVFEQTQALVTLPPLPIDFDWETLSNLEPVLLELEKEGAVRLEHVKSRLGEDFEKLAGLFEEEKGLVTLSSFGHLLRAKLQRAEDLPVMLSPSARRKLQELPDFDKDVVESLLDRVRNPIWRAQKYHSFTGTDLLVVKPGSTGFRLAICAIKDGMVYIAEIYTRHDDYEQDLPKRRRSDYDLTKFVPHYPKRIPVSAVSVGEGKEDAGLLLALDRARKAEADRDEALQMVEELSQEVQILKGRCQELEEKAKALEEAERARQSWNLLRRLRWALFRS